MRAVEQVPNVDDAVGAPDEEDGRARGRPRAARVQARAERRGEEALWARGLHGGGSKVQSRYVRVELHGRSNASVIERVAASAKPLG